MKRILFIILLVIPLISRGQDRVWFSSWGGVDPHYYATVYDSSATVTLDQDAWGVITNAWGNLLTIHDAEYITAQNDSIVMTSAGHYDHEISVSISAVATAKGWQLALFKNGQLYRAKTLRTTSSTDTGNATLIVYSDDVAGDSFSLRIVNTTNGDDAVIESVQWKTERTHR